MRTLVDLPVIALGGWVVWRAALGFFTPGADLVGLDYLLNALLILFAWLFFARTLVRALLGARTRRLLDGAQRTAVQALASSSERARRRAAEVLTAHRAPLERLPREMISLSFNPRVSRIGCLMRDGMMPAHSVATRQSAGRASSR